VPVTDPGESPLAEAKELIRRGQRRIAMELLEPWLEEYPEDADSWSVIAAAYFELDNFPEALDAAQQAVDLKPDSARNWCNLGMILRKMRKLYDAEKAQYQALTLDSTYDRARTELRKIHDVRTGRREAHESLGPS